MNKSPRLFAHTFLAVCLLALLPARAAAWGGEGHRITARVAWARMKPETRDKVLAILGEFGSLEHAATWPDTLYGDAATWGHTFPWHFVNIPTNSDHKYLESRDCAGGDCVIGAIARERVTLGNAANSASKRRAALRFVIHFVGDMHQPLHTTADNNDEGGNLKPVCFLNVCWESDGKNKNLHKVWDKMIILHTGLSEDEYVERIVGRIEGMSQPELDSILAGDTVRWAEDAHILAVEHAYQLPQTTPKKNTVKNKFFDYYVLGGGYYDANIGLVEQQLLRGGVRLAAILDETLD